MVREVLKQEIDQGVSLSIDTRTPTQQKTLERINKKFIKMEDEGGYEINKWDADSGSTVAGNTKNDAETPVKTAEEPAAKPDSSKKKGFPLIGEPLKADLAWAEEEF